MPRRRSTEAPEIQGTDASPTLATAIYLRVSTDEQARSGLGLAAQRTRCLAMAQVKGWPEPRLFADEGISGTKDLTKRPGLAALMREVRAGRVQVVIINDLSRLARRVLLTLSLIDELSQHGVSLVSCKEMWDATTPVGQFTMTMYAALYELERNQTRERSMAAVDERAKRDGERGGALPYGYERTADGPIIAPAQLPIVQLLFARRRGGWSLGRIARLLNGMEVSTPQGGRQWYPSTVKAILDNEPVYTGAKRGESAMRWPVILPSGSMPDGEGPGVAALPGPRHASD